MNMEPKRDEIEPEVVPKIQPSPPSKAVSTCSGEMSEKIIDNVNNMMIAPMAPPKPPQMMLKTPENQSMAKPSPPSMKELKTLPMMPDNTQHTIEKKPMYSSVNLLTDRNMHGMYSNAPKPNESCFSANVKLGLIQLVLSILLSAFGGLLIAKQASLSMLGSGVWSGIFAGICGALGLFNIQPLMNGFLACSLISIATSTTALAFTGIGLVRDYNFSQTDPGVEPAVFAASALTLLLVLHLFTSLFSVYYSALELCSKKSTADEEVVVMNYDKVQKYLKSLQAAGISNSEIDGYQNYINNAKMHMQQQRKMTINPRYYNMLMYPPPSSIYMTQSSRMSHGPYTMHHPYHYTQAHAHHPNENFYATYDEIKHARTMDRPEKPKRKRLPTAEQQQQQQQNESEEMAYKGDDRDLAESYLKSIEPKD